MRSRAARSFWLDRRSQDQQFAHFAACFCLLDDDASDLKLLSFIRERGFACDKRSDPVKAKLWWFRERRDQVIEHSGQFVTHELSIAQDIIGSQRRTPVSRTVFYPNDHDIRHDRRNTTMKGFELCREWLREYKS